MGGKERDLRGWCNFFASCRFGVLATHPFTHPFHVHHFFSLQVALSYDIAALLIEFNADVMAVDKKGRTPLFCACAEKRTQVVQYYCENAHDHLRLVSLADHRGDSPLHAAACNGHTQVVVMLISAGMCRVVFFSFLFFKASFCWSLFLICSFNFSSCCTLLFFAAANINAKNVRGLNPLELAKHNSQAECIAILAPHTVGDVPMASPNKSNVGRRSSSNGASSSSSSSSSSNYYGAPQTPTGQQAMQQVYNEQASMDYQPHNGWGGMSERGAQAASSSPTVHFVSSSERAGYDANVDPGLARLMAAVSTPGRGNDEEEEGETSKLANVVNMGNGGKGGGGGGGTTTMDPTFLRLAAAVAGSSSPNKQTKEQRHWVACLDPASGSNYYKDIITGHTQWDPPLELVNKEWRHSGNGTWTNVKTNEISSAPF